MMHCNVVVPLFCIVSVFFKTNQWTYWSGDTVKMFVRGLDLYRFYMMMLTVLA